MLRLALVSLLAIALSSSQPILAKGGGDGGNGGGNGGGGGQGNGNGGGGPGGGNDGGGHGGGQGNGNGGGGGQGNGNGGGNGSGSQGHGSGGSSSGDGKGGGNVGSGSGNQGSNNGAGNNSSNSGASSSKGGGNAGGAGSHSTGHSGGVGLGGSSVSGGSSNTSSSGKTSASASSSATPDTKGITSPRATQVTPVPAHVAPAPPSLILRGSPAALSLPASLMPRRDISGPETTGPVGSLLAQASIPRQLVEACHTSITAAALPYGAMRVEAVGAGRASRTRDGGLTAPLEVRVTYARANARQVRQSHVACQLDAAGAVVALR
jgi:hypothetical protein